MERGNGTSGLVRQPPKRTGGVPCSCLLSFFFRLNKFKECNVSSQATAWFKK